MIRVRPAYYTSFPCLVSCEKPDEGGVSFAGESLAGLRLHDICQRGMVRTFQIARPFMHLCVLENLILGACTRRARAAREETLERVYTLFPRLRERCRQIAGTLSGGEQQMAAIGRGLMSRPRLLMLDEPSLGLSPMLVRAIFDIIQEINRGGATILLVEQNVFRALKLSHRGYILENGRVAAEGSSQQLLHDPQVRTAYLGL